MGANRTLMSIGRKLGRYELKSRLAIGGMAEVWLAEATGISGFHKTVVLKTILPQFADDPNFVRMFTNEALLASVLNHHNIVQIFDLGEIEETYFIAMEYIPGRTLRQVQRVLSKEKKLAPPWVTLQVVMSVCDALDYAHSRHNESGQPLSIVHRDITPENIMLSSAGVTKVLDFGIAKARSATHFTQAGTLKGKFAYMAPERILAAHDGAQTDKRSDIYSIGVMLYELLIGQLPFHEGNELLLLRRIIDEDPPAPRKLAPWIPERLERVMLRSMAKDPAKRHQTAGQLREDLSEFLVDQRATTVTERHIARFLSSTFDDLTEAGQAAAGARKPKVLGTPVATHGFDPVEPLDYVKGTGPAAREAPGSLVEGHDTATRAIPSPGDDTPLRVLVVDGDGVTRRFVEIALTKEGFAVESAKGVTGALEILQTELVDLIISETDLPDMNGLQFHRRMSQETRLKDIPFVFLSADNRGATKAVALRNGVDEFLAKPCDASELVARVRALVARRRKTREALRRRVYVLAGDFTALPFPDLVGLLEMSRRTGTLTVITERAIGEVVFEKGRIIHAAFGGLIGPAAFYRLLGEVAGRFEFSNEMSPPAGGPTVTSSVPTLLMSGARVVDARRAAVGEPAMQLAESAAAARSGKRLPGPNPAHSLATHFELGIRDSFALGELRLWGSDEMAEWTASPGGRDRFHVHLLSEPADGVASLLPLSSPPTEREILTGMGPGEKMVGLDFFLRNERLLDVVLVDIHRPEEFDRHLRRRPSLLLVAPPGGSLTETQHRAVAAHVAGLAPSALLGIGNSGLKQALVGFAAGLGKGVGVHCLSGSMGEGESDLRTVLVEGIRLWASSAPPAGAAPARSA